MDRGNGFYLGAMVWNYGIVVFGVFPFILAAVVLGWISSVAGVYAALAAAVVVPLLTYRWSWSLWLMSYHLITGDWKEGRELRDE